MKYPITEMFHSPQGEGVHMGRNAFFVRLYGCDQKCGFCDSAATWHPSWKPPQVPQLTEIEIGQRIINALGAVREQGERAFVVLTGGEPCLYDLAPLIEEIQENLGRRVHIETAGHQRIPSASWITISPKFFATAPRPENWEIADEIKLICTSPEQIFNDVMRIFEELGAHRRRAWPSIWLHPEWSQRHNTELLTKIVETVKEFSEVRFGYQLHKLYRADALDPNSLPDVPLGGVVHA